MKLTTPQEELISDDQNFYKHLVVIRIIVLIETILIWQKYFHYLQYPPDMIVNMKAIYTPYHWFISIHILNRYTTSRISTEDSKIQLHLP